MMPNRAQFLFCIPTVMELGYLDMDKRIILIWIVSKWGMTAWTGRFRLRVVVGRTECSEQFWGYIKGQEFLD
jgi:hypothetical protein